MFKDISINDFLQNYWQKKPCVFKNVFSKQQLKHFPTPDELAGLSLDGANAKIITGKYQRNDWSVINTPFNDDIFSTLPEKHWTLLVQGVDRFIPEVYDFIDNFNFIPRWKFDDVLMSYASTGGSVGPHFDYYDVFLVQTSGKRRWRLSTKHCTDENYNPSVPLKIMQEFESEIDVIAEVGDIVYVPPKVAHFGESLSDDCTTASFGYRAYHANELADYVGKSVKTDNCYQDYYQDPIWKHNTSQTPALITQNAIKNANILTQITPIEFAEFVTQTDLGDEELLQEYIQENTDIIFLTDYTYQLHPSIKIAYLENFQVCIDGQEFTYPLSEKNIMIDCCNTRTIAGKYNIAKQLFNLGVLV